MSTAPDCPRCESENTQTDVETDVPDDDRHDYGCDDCLFVWDDDNGLSDAAMYRDDQTDDLAVVIDDGHEAVLEFTDGHTEVWTHDELEDSSLEEV